MIAQEMVPGVFMDTTFKNSLILQAKIYTAIREWIPTSSLRIVRYYLIMWAGRQLKELSNKKHMENYIPSRWALDRQTKEDARFVKVLAVLGVLCFIAGTIYSYLQWGKVEL